MPEEWISAAEAHRLVAEVTSPSTRAKLAICSRAHAGLIKAKAARLILHDTTLDDAEVPKTFWWAEGQAALDQNWQAGDFETWIDRRLNWKAYGVSFSRSGIEALIGPAIAARQAPPDQPAAAGGRPAAAWWDDLWVEICRQLWTGELQPKKQSEIEAAMMNWTTNHGHDAAASTIRLRARKLWTAVSREDKN